MDQAKKLIHFYQNIDKNENAGCSAVRSKNLEDASEIASRQQNDKIWAAQEKFLFELTSALARIRTSTYGICQKTGELIDKKRLMLVPHTTTCVQAKNQQLH
jgi:RNA polymerase-binding transcription factor DksA